MRDLNDRHDRLVAGLDTPDPIRAAFAAHPRHRYLPDQVWDRPSQPRVDVKDEPGRWADIVYRSDAVITHADDAVRGWATSSSSAPQLMADMIDAARVEPGMRVLEIGAGTGWNAAILSTLVGATGSVTTVDVDPDVADAAREHLAGTGVRVVTGAGPSGSETYDAIIATCAVSEVPLEWLDRVSLEAPIIVPWAPDRTSNSTPVVALRKSGWTCARGPFVREASFMRDRTQRPGAVPFPGLGREPDEVSRFAVTSAEVLESDLMTPLMLMLPGVRLGVTVRPFEGGHGWVVYLGSPDGSWTYLWPDGTVHSGGPERLVDRLAQSYETLRSTTRPDVSAFSLEVNPPSRACRVRAPWGAWEHRPPVG